MSRLLCASWPRTYAVCQRCTQVRGHSAEGPHALPSVHSGNNGVTTVQEAPLSSCLQRLVISCSVYSVSTLDFMSSRERFFSQKKGRPTKPGERAGWAHAWLLCGLRKFGKATASAAKVGGQSVPQSPGNEPAWPRVLPASPAGDGHGVCGLRGGVAALRR